MKLLKVSLVLAALVMAGCHPSEPGECKVPEPVVKERNDVIARRGALEVSLAKIRGEWADRCMVGRDMPVFTESDRPGTCIRRAADIYPDTITAQLLSEFNGDLTTPTQVQ